MKRCAAVLVFAGLLSACGGGASTPTQPTPPTTPPAPSTANLSGRVTETAPTTATPIAEATLTIDGGGSAGRTATTNANGDYTFSGISRGGFTMNVSAAGYNSSGFGVDLTGDLARTFALDPVQQILTTTRNETVSGGDACTGGPSTFGDGCKQYALNLHHGGAIDAVVTWSDGDTWIWLELYRFSDNVMVASASSSRINGLRQQISTSAAAHTAYIIRVRYAFGARITPFSLTVSRPS